MSRPIDAYKQAIIQTERAKGINTAHSKIIAEIFANAEDSSIEELAKKTGYSLATISNTIKFIEMYGSIIKIKKPGSKKIYVRAQRDFMKVFITSMNLNHENTIRPLKQILPELIKAQKQLIKESKKKEVKEQLIKELKIMKNHLKQVNTMEIIFDHVIMQCNKNRKIL